MTNTGGMEEHGAVDILGGNADSSIFYKYEMSSLVKHSCSHMLVLCSLGWLLPWICLLLGGFYCAGLLATHFLAEGQREHRPLPRSTVLYFQNSSDHLDIAYYFHTCCILLYRDDVDYV